MANQRVLTRTNGKVIVDHAAAACRFAKMRNGARIHRANDNRVECRRGRSNEFARAARH